MTFNDNKSAIDLILTRRSGKARDMIAPGPSRDELKSILTAGLRVPDHGKLAPWHFIVVEKGEQEALGAAFVDAYTAEKPDAGRLEIDAIQSFPSQAPVMIAVLSRLNTERAIPQWEQRLSAGAACQNMLMAAHALGYVANWLTGWCAYSKDVVRILGGKEDDRIAGFLFIGSQGNELKERPRPALEDVVRFYRAT